MFKVKKLPGHNDIDIIKTCTSFIGRPFMKAYFLRVDNVFIDSGNSGCSGRLLKGYLRGLEKRDRWLLINTHLHEDHCGNNARIQQTLGADILIHKDVDISKEMALFFRLFWGLPGKFKASIMKEEAIRTDAGRTIKAMHTPGHTDCHRCYYIEEDNILVTGDAIPFPARKVHCLPGEDYIQSIENLKNLKKYINNSAIFLTAHQGILDDPKATIEKRIENMEKVVRDVRKHWQESSGHLEVTLRAMFGKPNWLDRLMAPRMSHENTVKSIVSNSKK